MTDRRPRRLAAIMFLDIVGFSAMMSRDDEAATARVVKFHRRVEALIGEHHGRVVDTAGDSVFAVFDSIVDAVECAGAVQRGLATDDDVIMVRIGLHFGDVLVEGDNLYGDGVNIAARLEDLAPPGGIAVSDVVYQEVRNRLPFVDAGSHTLKNIDRKVRVYRVPPEAFGHPVAPDDLDDLDLTIDGLEDGTIAVRDLAAVVRERMATRSARQRGTASEIIDPSSASPKLPRPPRTPLAVLTSGGFWVRLTGGALLVASHPSGWTENGLYPLVGSILVAGALGSLIAAIAGTRSTRGGAFAVLVSAIGLAIGALFLEGTVSRSVVWVLAAATGGPAIITMIRGARD
jgi:class 3 adenylate cyclase